jgi:hypothetical protein
MIGASASSSVWAIVDIEENYSLSPLAGKGKRRYGILSLPLDSKGWRPYLKGAMPVLRETEGVLVVCCLRCGHDSKLSPRFLTRFGLKPNTPISAFVKRLRCSECGSGSVMAKRIIQAINEQGHQKRCA